MQPDFSQAVVRTRDILSCPVNVLAVHPGKNHLDAPFTPARPHEMLKIDSES